MKNLQYHRTSERIVPDDIVELKKMLFDAYEAVGRDIVHGDCTGTSPQEVVSNILSTIEGAVIKRWAHGFFPEDFHAVPDDELSYPDDDQFESEYEEYGFARQAN